MPTQRTDIVPLIALGGLGFIAWKLLGVFGKENQEGPKPEAPSTTFTLVELRAMCDVLFDALAAYATEDEAKAIATILRCRTKADVENLVYQFGNRFVLRRASFFTLPQLVHTFMSDAEINRLNAGLRAKGITYAF